MNNSSLKRFVKKAVTVAGLCAITLPSAAAWTVGNGKLLDPNANPFIFRGVTIDHTFAPEKTVQALKDIAALGANSAQIEFPIKYTDVFPRPVIAELYEIAKTCKEQKLVCVLEPNDVAGFGGVPGSLSPTATIGYWQDMYRSLYGMEDYVIIGLGNQHFDADAGSTIIYTSGIITYAQQLMSVLPQGFMVMIDGNMWSQDTDLLMQGIARGIAQQNDSVGKRIIYSVDFFDKYESSLKIRDYIAGFAQIGAPLVIGGFAPTPYYHPYNNIVPLPAIPQRLPAESVMQYAEEYGVGYFAWSLSGNKNSALDLVQNWDINALTAWGNLAINGVNGIKATAKRATHFSNSSSSVASSVSTTSSSSSSSAPNNPPIAEIVTSINYIRCGSVQGVASAQGSRDPDGDILTYQWQVNGSPVSSAIGDSISFFMQGGPFYTVKLTVSDGKGGTATATTSMRHSYSDNCTSSSSSSFRPSSSSVTTTSFSKPSSVPSSSVRPSSISSSVRSSSSIAAKANCSYVIASQWGNGFTAAIRVKNTSTQPLNGWSVNWQYSDGSKVTNSWNASLSGSNPYSAKNVGWNANIQPGQTVEFGFQGSKPAGAATIPAVTGSVCQ